MRTLGSDLVHDAVVVGSGRKYACLVIEAAQSGLDEDGRRHVAEELVKRLADFNRNLFAHERIEDPKRVIVVEKGTFLRTSVRPRASVALL